MNLPKIFSVVFLSVLLPLSAAFSAENIPKFYVSKNDGPRIMDIDFGSQQVGHARTLELIFEWDDLGTIYSDPVNAIIDNSTDIVITNDQCGGISWPNGTECSVFVKFLPLLKKNYTAHFNLSYMAYTGGGPRLGWWDFYLKGKGVPVTEDPNPTPPRMQVCKLGSIVRIDGQSLGEVVPVDGTNFSLNYSSEFSPEYLTYLQLPNPPLRYFNYNGWALSIQHYYDAGLRHLFLGTGTSEEIINAEVDPAGYRVFSYDGEEVYIFSSIGKHLETKYGLTGETKYLFGYDSSGKISTVADAFGNVTTFTYDSGGTFYTITAPFGQVTTVALNSSSLISSISNPNGETHSFTYKAGTKLLETFTKPGGQQNTFSYSPSGRLTKDEAAAGNFWSLSELLDPTGRIVTLSSQMGRETIYRSLITGSKSYRYEEEPSGLIREFKTQFFSADDDSTPYEGESITRTGDNRFPVVTVQRPDTITITKDSITSMTWYQQTVFSRVSPFDFSSLVRTATTNGRVTTSTYTPSNKTAITTSPMGTTTTSVIDSVQRPTSFQVGGDTAWTIAYDTFGRLSSSAQGAFNSLSRTYNSAGLLATLTNARSEVTSYTYDLAGRITQFTRPDLKVVSFTYDPNGNVTSITPPGKLAHVFEFNAMELMSKYDPPTLTGVTTKETLYSYNLDKQLTSIVRPDTQSVQFVYGPTTGLLNKVTLARGDNDYTYRSNTDLVSRIDSADGVRSNFTYYGSTLKSEEQRRASDDFLYAMIQYGFDSDHRKISRGIRGNFPVFSNIVTTLNNDSQPSQIGTMALTYTYPSGRLENTTLDKISDARTYDALGNLETYTASYNPTGGPSTVLYSYTLTRDAMSRIVGKTETIQGVTSTFVYTFDVVGRLTAVTKNGVAYNSYAYDDNGNRISGSVGGIPFTATYDSHDRLSTYNARTYSYNANGDNTQIQWTPTIQSTFSYDAMGMLLTAVTPTASTSYTMDGRGNIVRIVNGSATLTRYIYDDLGRIAGEFTDAGVMWRQFVYGTDDYSPDYLIDSTGSVRFIKDHLGSPRLLVRVNNGSVLQRMDYDEFGRVLANTNPTYQPFGFAGGLFLRLPGLVKFGARFYDSEIGRWTSKDPIRFAGDDTNLYGYVANDPINFIDPSGLKPGDEFGSEHEAAIDAINWITPKSRSEGVEYGGWVVKKGKKFVATMPIKGTETSVNVGNPPSGAVADYHTHVPKKCGENTGRNRFSDQDISGNKKYNVRGYLGTPTQGIKVNTNGLIIEGF